MTFTAVILAAGSSSRAGFDKTTAMLGGKPVWRWSYDQYRACEGVSETLVVVSEANEDVVAGAAAIRGGQTRQESVLNALSVVQTEGVLLHDAARPLVSARLIEEVIAAVEKDGAAAAGVPVVDTIKLREDGKLSTLDRSRLVAMQTPQGARADLMREAHAKATGDATDDMALLEAIGVQPTIVPGDPHNFKITTAEDLARARAIVGDVGLETRIGFGYDVHPFSAEEDRVLMLGGVAFPDHQALDGHSDADVVLHAVTDAVLGAAGLGDIGRHFPNTDMRWKGEPSLTFLRAAAQMLGEQGWSVVNVDVTVVAESPKITPRADEMIGCIAAALGITGNRVSVKATTNERMGFVGRGEGIAVTAVASIRRSD